MKRKTATEILSSDDANEIHDWLWSASLDELREFLRRVKREEHWGIHARDALDILIASENQKIVVRVGWLTVVAIVLALLQVIAAIAAIRH